MTWYLTLLLVLTPCSACAHTWWKLFVLKRLGRNEATHQYSLIFISFVINASEYLGNTDTCSFFSLSPLISMSTPSCSPTQRWHLSWHKPVIMAQGTSTVWKSGTELQIPNIQHNYLSTWYAQILYVSCSYRTAIGYLRRLEKNGNHFHCHLACQWYAEHANSYL